MFQSFAFMSRRDFIAAAAMAAAGIVCSSPRGVFAAEPEKRSVTIAVGGKNLYYYLPMALADWMGFYKDEGLVLQDRAPQCVFAINRSTMKGVKDPAALKGRRIGVTAPGSHSHVMANFVMARAGVKSNEYSAIGIGSGAGAVAAVRSGQVDAFVGLDPVVTQLEEADAIDIVVDTRRVEEGDALYNGPMVAGCLYAPQTFIDRNPETVQRMTNAVIRSLKTIAAITSEELMKSVPKAAFLGNPKLYAECFLRNRPAMSIDGRFPEGCVETAAKALASVKPELADFKFDAAAAYTNRFVDAAKKA